MTFRNISYLGQSLISDNLEANIIAWLNWNLLGVGGFGNIVVPQSVVNYGGQPSVLRLTNNPNYSTGQVWEAYRKQFVWQSGIDYSTQPIQISGVYVNNTFQPTSGVGPYKFKVDYSNGRIIFDNPISTHAQVKLEYSYNYVQIYNADCPFWRDVQRNSFRIDDSSFNITSSGIWAKNAQQRIQLPAIIVQYTPNITKVPYEIGNLAYFHRQSFRFYIITETSNDCKFLFDAITTQGEQQFGAFDTKLLRASGIMPMNLDGSLNNMTMNYPDLVRRFGWGRSWEFLDFKNPVSDLNDNSLPLFTSIINTTVQTIIP